MSHQEKLDRATRESNGLFSFSAPQRLIAPALLRPLLFFGALRPTFLISLLSLSLDFWSLFAIGSPCHSSSTYTLSYLLSP